MAVTTSDFRNRRQSSAPPAGLYNRRTQFWALTGALIGMIILAAGHAGLMNELGEPDLSWMPPVVAIGLVAWLPIAQTYRWLRTGLVQAGAIALLLGAGAAAIGDFEGAGFILCIWTCTAVMRARVYAAAAKPIMAWETLTTGHWPDWRTSSAKHHAHKSKQQIENANSGAAQAGPISVPPRGVIPCDGVVEQTGGLVSSIWNPLPATNIEPGDLVYAGDVNLGETLLVRPVRSGADSALARAAATARRGLTPTPQTSKSSAILRIWSLVWSVLAVVAAAAAPFVLGTSVQLALARSLALLALTLPGAWGAAIELPAIAATGAAVRHGFIPKSGWVMEYIGKLGMLTLVWDVTFGRGRRLVADVLPLKPKACSPMELLAVAAAVEVAAAADDPVAEAIRSVADKEGISVPVAQDGRRGSEGAMATVDGHVCLVGSERFMYENQVDISLADGLLQQLEQEECHPVYCAAGGYLLGAVGISDMDRHEWPRIAEQLHQFAVKLVVINGNPEEGRSAWAPGHPEGMVSLLAGQEISTLRSWNKGRNYVGVIGDAGRDRDILGQADVGMAAGPTAAVEDAGHLLLLNDDLTELPWIMRLGRRLRHSNVRMRTLAVASRLVLAGLVLAYGFNALEVVAADAVVFVLVAASSMRLLGKGEFPLPHRRLAVERRKRSRGRDK